MIRMLMLVLTQSVLLCAGQVMLKMAMNRAGTFVMSAAYLRGQLTNWWFPGCGVFFVAAGLLWMYILKHYPFSQVYPLTSVTFLLGMVAAVLFLHEQTEWQQWLGVAFIIIGCMLVVK